MEIMEMPASVTDALEGYNSTVVIVNNANEKIKNRYEEIFRERWNEAYDNVVEELDIDDVNEAVESEWLPLGKEDSFPLKGIVLDGSDLILEFSELYIQYCYGDFCDIEYSLNAFDDSFAELKEEFPEIRYVGICTFFWSDRRCGDTVYYNICDGVSNEEKLDCINQIEGRIITNAVNKKTYMGNPVFDDEDDNQFLSQIKEEYEFIDEDEKENLERYFEYMRPYIGTEEYGKIAETIRKCNKESEN